MIEEYNSGIILKLINEHKEIIGSVRAKEENKAVFISKFTIHPDYRKNGCGIMLLKEVEKYYPKKRYELFTSKKYKQHSFVPKKWI